MSSARRRLALRREMGLVRYRLSTLSMRIVFLSSKIPKEDVLSLKDRLHGDPSPASTFSPGSVLSESWVARNVFNTEERAVIRLVALRVKQKRLEERLREIRGELAE